MLCGLVDNKTNALLTDCCALNPPGRQDDVSPPESTAQLITRSGGHWRGRQSGGWGRGGRRGRAEGLKLPSLPSDGGAGPAPSAQEGRLGVRLRDSSLAVVSGSAPGAASGLGFGSPEVRESQKLKLGQLIQVFYF